MSVRYARYELSRPVCAGLLSQIAGATVHSDRWREKTDATIKVRGASVSVYVAPETLRSDAEIITVLHIFREEATPAGCQCGRCSEADNVLFIRCAGTAAQQIGSFEDGASRE